MSPGEPPPEPTRGHSPRISEIRTTLDDRGAAEAVARRLVEQRLAACVQIEAAIESIYRWKDSVERSAEWRITVKTSIERTEACVASILSQHSYDLPEILVTEPVASRAYSDWVRESTSP